MSTVDPARKRVFDALAYQPPDVVPVEYHASPAGSYEHGRKLHELWARFPADFGDGRNIVAARPDPKWVDAQGRYEELRRDEWGVLWRQLMFGVAGHPVERPLDDWSRLDDYRAPEVPPRSGPIFEREQEQARQHQEEYFLKSGWISIFEVMHAVRRFEDVLMDLAEDSPQLHRLADLITEYQLQQIHFLLARGVDAVQFGDDFATQSGLMFSPEIWRHFFKPRFERLMAPIHRAGKKVFFHTCGAASALLDELADLGVHALWPQLNAYPIVELARRCRERKLAVALHPDRGDLMVRGHPREVRNSVQDLAEVFSVRSGGAWFYVEIDSGFPFENVETLVRTIAELRGMA